MLKNLSHAEGLQQPAEEILFSTAFGYLFPELAALESAKLPVNEATIPALLNLGQAMADLGTPGEDLSELDSAIPSVFTYLGQFIDHDITARTDRDGDITRIGEGEVAPVDPKEIVAKLKNGRRPQLDLDSLYGDGPGLIGRDIAGGITQAEHLYAEDLQLRVESADGYIDLPRSGRKAEIGDMRNDENVMISQLHAAFLKFHNVVACALPGHLSAQNRYVQARQLVRWAYQYVVVNDYLKAVCAPSIVEDLLLNGPRFYRPGFNDGELFMPLEFSVAGFRFGHSMIRPFYQLNRHVQLKIMDLLGVSKERPEESDLLEATAAGYRLKPELLVDWDNFVAFVSEEPVPNRARRIDPLIAKGLFNLGLDEAPPGSIMAHLAQRNLLRGYSLSIPTGQAVAKALGYCPLGRKELVEQEENPQLREALDRDGLCDRTPLWYYVLKEAAVQTQGNSLGAVGSTIVAETLVGLVKLDPNSYLNNFHHPAVQADGIHIAHPYGEQVISTIGDILYYAGLR